MRYRLGQLKIDPRAAAGKSQDKAHTLKALLEQAVRKELRRRFRRGSVQISNFVGFALDAAAELGFSRALLAGQPGKLVKVAGGCMQTHSRFGDGRRETLVAHLALMGAPFAKEGEER